MRIFNVFLIILLDVILWFLPFSDAIYSFRTDARDDTFTVSTGVGISTANLTLLRALWEDDTATIVLTSNISETLAVDNYNTSTRGLDVSGFTENVTRSLMVTYDVASLSSMGLDAFAERTPLIWMLILIVFPLVAIIAVFTGRL